jgi:dTDP-glucose 4,6-dehydratase
VNPVGLRGVYDEAKRFAEAMTMAYHRYHGLDTRIVRIFNTYGPRMRLNDGRAFPAFVSQALTGKPLTVFGDGTQTRSFCYIDDLVEGIFRVLHCSDCEPMNLGNPDEVSILDFAREVLEVTRASSTVEFHPLPEDEPKVRRPDISCAREVLSWNPVVSRREGLQRTLPFFAASLGVPLPFSVHSIPTQTD